MRTVDRITVRAPLDRVLQAAVDVEQWPEMLSHYRWVRMLERVGEGGLVEMAAWRPFGKLRYPTWWVSEMQVDRPAAAVRYRHVRGITRGMNVQWSLRASGTETEVEIIHEWTGPAWPLIGPAAATLVIGPVFIHGIASRTLAGLARYVEAAGQQERRHPE
jgi:uncharacterized membrane protein